MRKLLIVAFAAMLIAPAFATTDDATITVTGTVGTVLSVTATTPAPGSLSGNPGDAVTATGSYIVVCNIVGALGTATFTENDAAGTLVSKSVTTTFPTVAPGLLAPTPIAGATYTVTISGNVPNVDAGTDLGGDLVLSVSG